MTDPASQFASQRSKTEARWALALTIAASSVAFIDMTIVNLALPVMQRDLGSSFQEMQWVVEAYVLFLTALTLTGGGMADVFGRRKVLCMGAGLFLVASVLAGLAADANQLIAARALQGVGGAMLAPASLAIVSSSFAPEERGKALGQWAAFSSISTAFAPALGGILMDIWSWRAIFFINIPILLFVLILAPRKIRESKRASAVDGPISSKVDYWGGMLAVLALAPLTYGLLRAGQSGLDDAIVIASLGFAVAMVVTFIEVERRVPAPMMPLPLFRSKVFAGMNAMTLVQFIAISAVMFFLPMTLIQAFQYTPVQAGAAMIPSMAVMFLTAPKAGKLADRYGPKWLLAVGPWISAAAFIWFAQVTSTQYVAGVLGPILVMGLGFGTWVSPLTSAVMSAAGEKNAGVASGINNAIARLAQLLAIALMGILATMVFNQALDIELARAGFDAASIDLLAGERDKLGAMSAPDGLAERWVAPLEDSVRSAFRQVFAAVCYSAAVLCVVASFLGYWATRGIDR